MKVRARVGVLVAAVALSASLGACASDPPDAEAERTERVLDRLELTFSRAQSNCIIERLEPETMTALDGEEALEPDTVAMLDYTDALSVCVIDGGEADDDGS
jgi:hypothetical protein